VKTDTLAPRTGSVVSVASALSALEPVRVTGPSNPASELFAGTLVLGKWRLRGNIDGTFYLERFDDDGAIVSDAWAEVARFGFNTNNNSPGFETQNLGVTYNLSAGDTYTNAIRPRDTAQVTIDSGLAVTGALSASEPVRVTGPNSPPSELFAGTLVLGKWRFEGNDTALRIQRYDDDGALQTGGWVTAANLFHNQHNNTSHLEVQLLGVEEVATLNAVQVIGELTTNSIRATNANEVTIADSLRVTGVLEAQSNVGVTGQVAAQSMFCNTDLTVLGNLYGWVPYWACGSFDGQTLQTRSDSGRYPFSVSRPQGLSTGVFRIAWAQPHPRGSYFTVHITAENGFAYVRGRAFGPVTETGFDIIVRDVTNFSQSVNPTTVHFTVHP
jgi:hypothetical protein